MSKQRVVVTGGCGFIGSHLVDRLVAEGHTVSVVDNLSSGRRANLNPKARLIEADISDETSVGQALGDADLCYHLAAVASVGQSVEHWRRTTLVNLAGSVTVFEACAQRGAPVVYASSAAVYGAPERIPLAEDAPTAPNSPYGVDKLAMEWHARAGGVCRGLRSAGLRLFNVYGPRQDPASPYSGVISQFAEHARRGADLEIHGDGNQTRDFVQVADVVDALTRVSAGVSVDAPVFNVATGAETSITDLAGLIVRLSGSSSSIRRTPRRPGDIVRSCGDAGALNRAFGWTPRVGVEEGLAALLGRT